MSEPSKKILFFVGACIFGDLSKWTKQAVSSTCLELSIAILHMKFYQATQKSKKKTNLKIVYITHMEPIKISYSYFSSRITSQNWSKMSELRQMVQNNVFFVLDAKEHKNRKQTYKDF